MRGASRRHVSLAAETRIHHYPVSCGCKLWGQFDAAVRSYSFVGVRRYSEGPALTLLEGAKCAARTGDKTWHCKTTRKRSSDMNTRLYAQQPHLHSRGALCASTDRHRPRVRWKASRASRQMCWAICHCSMHTEVKLDREPGAGLSVISVSMVDCSHADASYVPNLAQV